MTTSYTIAAPPGQTVDPGQVAELTEVLAGRPGVAGVRVATTAGLSWQERAAIKQTLDGDDPCHPGGHEV